MQPANLQLSKLINILQSEITDIVSKTVQRQKTLGNRAHLI